MTAEQVADGWHRMTDNGDEWESIVHVDNGVIGDDLVEWMLEQGYTFEPMVVMTKAEHAELEKRLAEAWQPVNPIYMVDDKYDDAEIKLCYRRTAPTGTRREVEREG